MDSIPGNPRHGRAMDESTQFLYSLETFGIKMDLQNISALMRFAGEPHRRLKIIHVAGTNGKGSTCALLASALSAQGYRVGLYTSPHIVDFTERIRIDGRRISPDELTGLTSFFREEIVRLRATFFEATTAIMFKYFSDMNVDFAVIETGLGGRLDATNIADPLVSVVTGIGMDHTDVLGDTIEKIAAEKAGIIKTGRPAIVNVTAGSVKDVFTKAAGNRKSELFFVAEVASAKVIESGIGSSVFSATVFGESFDAVELGMGGRHQVSNALTALSTLEVLRKSGVDISRPAILDGLREVGINTGHRGRLEILSRQPLVILDVAHNPDGIRALVESIGTLLPSKGGTVLFGAMKDKEAAAMLNNLRERFTHIILTQLKIGRSLGADDLKKLSNNIKLTTQVFDNSTEALRAALSQTDNDSFLLITGSHYLAGEVLPVFDKSVIGLEGL